MKPQKPNLFQPQSNAFIKSLSILTCVTKNDFELLYVEAVNKFSEYIQAENPSYKTELFIENLNTVINALKRRRGFLLPVGSDSESSFREREEWTYAVFSASLLQMLEPSRRLNAALQILPKSAMTWLQRNRRLYELWVNYLQEGEINIFTEVIGGGNKIKTTILENKTETAVEKYDPAKNKINKEISVKTDKPSDTAFWEWLKQGVVSQQLSINEDNSIVHGTGKGVLICMPQAIEVFCSQVQMSEIPIKQRIALANAVKKNPLLVRTAKGSRTFFYCLGKWDARKIVSGVIAPSSMLFNTDVIPLNESLSLDPLHNT